MSSDENNVYYNKDKPSSNIIWLSIGMIFLCILTGVPFFGGLKSLNECRGASIPGKPETFNYTCAIDDVNDIKKFIITSSIPFFICLIVFILSLVDNGNYNNDKPFVIFKNLEPKPKQNETTNNN